MRVWLMTNIPSPYQVQLLSHCAQHPRAELSVRFMRPGESGSRPEIEGADTNYMLGIGLSRTRDELRLNPRGIFECCVGDWDVYVLSGTMASPTFLMCAMALFLRGKTWVLWLERPHPAASQAKWGSSMIYKGPLRAIRNAVMRWLLRNCSGLIAMGELAADEYARRGMDPEKIRSLPYCCDVDRFVMPDQDQVKQLTGELQTAGKIVYLFSGQLIERKGIDTLLAAFGMVAAQRDDVALIILGSGPSVELVREFQKRSPALVIHPGRIPQADLPLWFALADVFVFPSRHDGWAVVVNEACAAGLPVLASQQTGAAHDLVEPDVNGQRIGSEDAAAFAEAMLALARQPEKRQRMGRASRETVRRFSPERGAGLFVAHLADFLCTRNPRSAKDGKALSS